MHDLCLEVLTVHDDDFFGSRHFVRFDIAEVGAIFYTLAYGSSFELIIAPTMSGCVTCYVTAAGFEYIIKMKIYILFK